MEFTILQRSSSMPLLVLCNIPGMLSQPVDQWHSVTLLVAPCIMSPVHLHLHLSANAGYEGPLIEKQCRLDQETVINQFAICQLIYF